MSVRKTLWPSDSLWCQCPSAVRPVGTQADTWPREAGGGIHLDRESSLVDTLALSVMTERRGRPLPGAPGCQGKRRKRDTGTQRRASPMGDACVQSLGRLGGARLEAGFLGAHQIIELLASGVLGCEHINELWVTQITRERARRTLGVSDVVVSLKTRVGPGVGRPDILLGRGQ